MRYALTVLGLLLVVGGAVAQDRTASGTPTLGFDRYRNAVVHVGKSPKGANLVDDKPIWLGTGFVLDGECTFVTAKHVLASVGETDMVVVRFQLPQERSRVITRQVEVLRKEQNTDLAFLKIRTISDQACTSGNLNALSLLSSVGGIGALGGERVLIIGHPSVADKDVDVPVVRGGIIASAEMNWLGSDRLYPMLLLDLTGVPGFSGSPVILEGTGMVVGVVYGPGPTPRTAGFEWATPLTLEDYTRAVAQSPVDSKK